MSKEDLDIQATGRLIGIARKWYDQMLEGQIPSIALPTRTKQNIEYESGNMATGRVSAQRVQPRAHSTC